MSYSKEESTADSYIKKAEHKMWKYGGGKNDKHWHRDVRQVAVWLSDLDRIDNTWNGIKSKPYEKCGDDLKQLEKDRKHIQHQINERGKSHSIRGKGSSSMKR